MVGYIFGGNSGNSYESLQRKRQTADLLRRQLMGEKPKTALEGVAAILKGAAIGYGSYRNEKEIDERTKGSVDNYNRAIEAAMGAQGSGGTSSMAQAIMDGKPLGAGAGGSGGNYRDAIASIESAGSGDYAAVGPTNQKLGRPLGRYQVMEANVGPWSKQALGREVTPDEFLANPQIQDAVFDHQFKGYVDKYGPEGAAQAWFGGPGAVGKTGRKDMLGTSVGGYGAKFMNALSPQQVASLDPSAGMASAYAPMPQTGTQAIEAQAPVGGGLASEVAAFEQTPEYAAQYPGRQPQRAQAAMPALPAAQTVGPAPAVAGPQLMQPQGQPQQVAQAGPQGMQGGQFNPFEGIDPQLLRSLNDPFLPPEMKQSLQTVIEQRMRANQQNYQAQSEQQQWLYRQQYEQQARQADPSYQLDMEAKRAQIESLRAKPSKQWQKLDDDTLFNPETGETRELSATGPGGAKPFRFGGNAVEAQALNGLMDSGQLTPDQAQQLGAGKTITGPNGEMVFMTPQGVFSQTLGGPPQPIGGAPSAAGMPPQSQAPQAMPSASQPTAAPMPPQAAPQMPPMMQPQRPQTLTPQPAQTGAAPMSNPGMIQLTGPKNNTQIPAEMGARIGMGDAFLQELPGIRARIQNGDASGPIDGIKLKMGVGDPASIWRDIETGRDALVRNLTGAGMSGSEAANQTARYQISATDTAETMLEKLDNLERDLRATRAGALGARTGTLGEAPGAGAGEAPAAGGDALAAARAAIARGAPRDAVMKRLQDSGINPEGL